MIEDNQENMFVQAGRAKRTEEASRIPRYIQEPLSKFCQPFLHLASDRGERVGRFHTSVWAWHQHCREVSWLKGFRVFAFVRSTSLSLYIAPFPDVEKVEYSVAQKGERAREKEKERKIVPHGQKQRKPATSGIGGCLLRYIHCQNVRASTFTPSTRRANQSDLLRQLIEW